VTAAAAAAVDDRGYIRPELAHLAQPIRTYRPYPGNARRGNRQTIRDSLLSHGQYKPLIVQHSTGHILVGNNTWHVMVEQGWSHAAFQVLDLDDVAARKLLLMDNASSDAATYNDAELADLLAELPTFAGSGFREMDLDRLLAELNGGAPLESLPSVEDALPVSPAGPPLPDRPTADPMAVPTPPAPVPAPTPAPVPDPVPVPPPVPAPDPRTAADPPHPPAVQPQQLAPVLPPRPPTAAQPPTADVTWPLTLTRADRDEAHRLVAHARDWLDDPDLPAADIVLRALRTLAAIGDARHNTTLTINITTLLMAAGRDPLTAL
jgi:hypothetical protein